jgi:hypothetical protein
VGRLVTSRVDVGIGLGTSDARSCSLELIDVSEEFSEPKSCLTLSGERAGTDRESCSMVRSPPSRKPAMRRPNEND